MSPQSKQSTSSSVQPVTTLADTQHQQQQHSAADQLRGRYSVAADAAGGSSAYRATASTVQQVKVCFAAELPMIQHR
jgi:hypothetical protein